MIRKKWSEVELRKDCKKRFGWKSTEFDLIQWSESGRVFRNADFYHRQFITRYVYKRLPVKKEKNLARSDKKVPMLQEDTRDHRTFYDMQGKQGRMGGTADSNKTGL